MKLLKNILLVCILTLCIPIVHAQESKEVYYTNHLGVEMTEDEYNLLLNNNYDESFISGMNQEKFDEFIKNPQELKPIGKETKYIITKTMTDNLNNTFVVEKEVTKEEAESVSEIAPIDSCGVGCWQTSSKRIELEYYYGLSNTQVVAHVLVVWYTTPNVKSFDVTAVRWTNSLTLTDYYASQFYVDSEGGKIIEYNPGNGNYKIASNGLGISMNIVDALKNSLEINLYVYGDIKSNAIPTMYATYQHATSGVTLAQSQDYTFSSSGLGGVLLYNSATIRDRYDGMQGVHVSL